MAAETETRAELERQPTIQHHHADIEENSPTLFLSKTRTTEEVQKHGRQVHGFKWFLVCFAIYSTALMYGLDTTIAADVQGPVIETFGRVQDIAWMGIGFPLGSVATILPIGMSFGLFNAKWLFIVFVILFEAGSALCGGAPNMDALIIGRVIAGIGGAGIYLGALNILSVLTTIQERALYIALVGLVWGIGTILGPVVGGLFAVNSPTWRWAFYINLVIAGIFAPVYLFLLPSFKPRPELSIWAKIKMIDWIGAVLVAAVYALFVTALTFGGATWAWSDGRIIAMLVVLGVITIVTAFQQSFAIFTTKYSRIVPLQFLKHKTIVLLYFGAASSATALFVPIYYIPVYFQFAQGDSALKAAVRLLPYILVCITFIMLNGALMPKFGHYKFWYLWTGVLLVISGALFYTVDEHTSAGKIYGYSVIMAVGAGSTVQAMYSIAETVVGENETAAIIGLMNTAQLGSIVICLTISGAIFQNLAFSYLSSSLAQFNFSSEEIRSAIAGTTSTILTSASDEAKQLAIAGIVRAISKVYALIIAAGALSIVSAIFMKRENPFASAHSDEEKLSKDEA